MLRCYLVPIRMQDAGPGCQDFEKMRNRGLLVAKETRRWTVGNSSSLRHETEFSEPEFMLEELAYGVEMYPIMWQLVLYVDTVVIESESVNRR
jgi:hypothetical protein